jgi:hypothetical protein
MTELKECKLLITELNDEVKTLRAAQPSNANGTQLSLMCVEELTCFDTITEFEEFCLTLYQDEILKKFVSIFKHQSIISFQHYVGPTTTVNSCFNVPDRHNIIYNIYSYGT